MGWQNYKVVSFETLSVTDDDFEKVIDFGDSHAQRVSLLVLCEDIGADFESLVFSWSDNNSDWTVYHEVAEANLPVGASEGKAVRCDQSGLWHRYWKVEGEVESNETASVFTVVGLAFDVKEMTFSQKNGYQELAIAPD